MIALVLAAPPDAQAVLAKVRARYAASTYHDRAIIRRNGFTVRSETFFRRADGAVKYTEETFRGDAPEPERTMV